MARPEPRSPRRRTSSRSSPQPGTISGSSKPRPAADNPGAMTAPGRNWTKRTLLVPTLAATLCAIKLAAAASLVLLLGGACTPDLIENRLPDTHIRAALGDQPVRGFGDGRGHRMAVLDRTDGNLAVQGYKCLDDHTDETLYLSIPHPRAGGQWQLGRPGRGAWAIYAAHEITPDRTGARF